MKTHQIAVLAGDGIGPEVLAQARKVLDAVGERFGHRFAYYPALVGAVAIDATGDPLPQETLDTCLSSDAILFGAIGHPRYDNDPTAKVRPEQGLLRLRKALGLFANLRPVTIFPSLQHLAPLRPERLEGVDMLIVRELTGGIYFGEKGRPTPDSAFDHCTYSREEIERVAHIAFRQAQNRRGKLTLVDKANVLETSRLWRETIQGMQSQYPGVTVDFLFVDNAAMQLILSPAQFDVVLTENMFGDILSDESSVLAGSLGLLPSSSIGEKTALFEPIHGSYPQAAGKDIANPLATILSGAMLLDHLGLLAEGAVIREAVARVLSKGLGTPDLQPAVQCSCSEMGDIVAHLVSDADAPAIRGEQVGQRLSTII
jgi:3-isopropylmalate dehydrogenase